MRKKKFLLILGLFLSFQLSPATSPGEDFFSQPEKLPQVAVLLPLSGPFTELGQVLRSGFELGFAGPADAGSQTERFSVSYLDSRGDPENCRALVELLSSQNHTVLIAGTPLNPTAWTTAKTCEKQGLPFLMVWADQDDLISDRSLFSFRLTAPRSALKSALQNLILSQQPAITKLGIIYSPQPCSRLQARRLRNYCADLPVDLTIWEAFPEPEKSLADLLDQIEKQQPQLLLLAVSLEKASSLWLQKEPLQTFPRLSVVVSNALEASASIPPSSTNNHFLLYPCPAPTTATLNRYPVFTSQLQAVGYAAAETIRHVLAHSPDFRPETIIRTLENTSLATAGGQVSFSAATADKPGHQNRFSGCFCYNDSQGRQHSYFPPPQNPKKNQGEH